MPLNSCSLALSADSSVIRGMFASACPVRGTRREKASVHSSPSRANQSLHESRALGQTAQKSFELAVPLALNVVQQRDIQIIVCSGLVFVTVVAVR